MRKIILETMVMKLQVLTMATVAGSTLRLVGASGNHNHNRIYYGNSVNIRSPQHRKLLTSFNIFEPNGVGESAGDIMHIKVPQKPLGDESCPCLTEQQLAGFTRDSNDNTNRYFVDGRFDASYGLGCKPHDQGVAKVCVDVDGCATEIPLPENCGNTWCYRSFCYVNPDNCTVNSEPSDIWDGLYYSYGTCGHMDSFTFTERESSLKNKTLRVALNSNTGGWMGAYNNNGSFTIDQNWDGPLVHFMKDAANQGGFILDMQRPPEWLANESLEFFGSSQFDYCVYAVSLGYLDLCIAAYTITSVRASVTPFFELTNDPIYMITFQGDSKASSWEAFMIHLMTIFLPFTPGSWAMIVCFVLPVLGLLMLYHEYHAPGGAFPLNQDLYVIDNETKKTSVVTREIPLSRHAARAVYFGILSFVSGSYNVGVITTGGKIHLLAILAFLVLSLAIYTANLAAILTTTKSKSAVQNIDEAIKAGYSFCSSRKMASSIMQMYPIQPEMFVPDPVHLGGDGLPGFNCPDCEARSRVFDFMKQNHNDPSLYCDAAIIANEDLQVLQNYGLHCNKTVVGKVLALATKGIPLKDDIAAEMSSFLYRMKYEGTLDKHIQEATPKNQCAVIEHQAEGIGLSIEQLTGIWAVVFTIVLVGLLTKHIQNCVWRSSQNNAFSYQKVMRFDQWGNPMDDPHVQSEEKETFDDFRKSVTRSIGCITAESDAGYPGVIEDIHLPEHQKLSLSSHCDEEDAHLHGSSNSENWWEKNRGKTLKCRSAEVAVPSIEI